MQLSTYADHIGDNLHDLEQFLDDERLKGQYPRSIWHDACRMAHVSCWHHDVVIRPSIQVPSVDCTFFQSTLPREMEALPHSRTRRWILRLEPGRTSLNCQKITIYCWSAW